MYSFIYGNRSDQLTNEQTNKHPARLQASPPARLPACLPAYLKFMTQTKVVAFADDLILATRGESVKVVENYSNAELSKIALWSKNKKIIFNERKSKVMLVSRRKLREHRNITVLVNNKPLEQVTRMKYLVIILDYKFRFQEHKLCCRNMPKTYLQLIKNGRTAMGN